MSSFNNSARRVRDGGRPTGERFRAFLWAIEPFAFLTGQRFHAVYLRLGSALGFDWNRLPTDRQLVDAVAQLERERNAHLAELRAFARRRIREKGRGRRQLSAADRMRWGWHRRPR